MSFEADFLPLMTATISSRPITGRDQYGGPILGSPVTFPGHITYKRRFVQRSVDERVLSTATLQIPPPGYTPPSATPVPELQAGDEISLPSDTIARHVIEVILYDDQSAGASSVYGTGTYGGGTYGGAATHHHQTIYLT